MLTMLQNGLSMLFLHCPSQYLKKQVENCKLLIITTAFYFNISECIYELENPNEVNLSKTAKIFEVNHFSYGSMVLGAKHSVALL